MLKQIQVLICYIELHRQSRCAATAHHGCIFPEESHQRATVLTCKRHFSIRSDLTEKFEKSEKSAWPPGIHH